MLSAIDMRILTLILFSLIAQTIAAPEVPQIQHVEVSEMTKRNVGFLGFALFLILPAVADQKPPVFVFGGKSLYVGMPKHEALTALSDCCKLSPPAESEVEKKASPPGVLLGHFILPKEETPDRILGTISFLNGKILRITRPTADGVDTWNDDVVGFARALKRSLPLEASDSGTNVFVSVRHERAINAEADVVLISFPNGRGIELHIGTLDKADPQTNKRDFATMDETLEASR